MTTESFKKKGTKGLRHAHKKKNHVKMKAETGVLPPQAKEHQRYSANHKKLGKRF